MTGDGWQQNTRTALKFVILKPLEVTTFKCCNYVCRPSFLQFFQVIQGYPNKVSRKVAGTVGCDSQLNSAVTSIVMLY